MTKEGLTAQHGKGMPHPRSIPFDKYDDRGAYHWAECDRNSSIYNPPLEARYEVVRRKIPRTRRLLDIGCGDGYLMHLLSEHCVSIVGIDSQHAAVVLASDKLRNYSNCSVMQASCYQIPIGNSSFDTVVLTDVFEHLESPEICLAEVCRVLSPTGSLLVTTPKWKVDGPWDHRHVNEYTADELERYLRRFFDRVTTTFFWPNSWYRAYITKIGWRLGGWFARTFYNPFLREGANAERYGQILAVCDSPQVINHVGKPAHLSQMPELRMCEGPDGDRGEPVNGNE